MAQTQSYPAILNSQLAVDDTIIITDTSGPYTIKKLTFTELDKRFVTKSGNSTIVGDLTATNFIGDGSGLTGIASGTGGIINTGSTTLGADSDADGVGVLVLQTRGVTRLTVANLGNVGIGETSPAAKLHVNDGTGGDAMAIFETTDSGAMSISLRNSTNDWRIGMESDEDFIIQDFTAGTIPLTIENGADNALYIASSGLSSFKRKSSDTNIDRSIIIVKHQTDQDMIDGFGANILFRLEDATSGELPVGILGFERDGADNEGKFYIECGTNAGERFFAIAADGGVYMYDLLAAAASTDVNINGSDELHSVTSSRRYKENEITSSLSTDNFDKIVVKEYDFKEQFGGVHEHGIIAEDLELLYPEFVYKKNICMKEAVLNDEDEEIEPAIYEYLPDSVQYSRLSLLCIKKIQELEAKLLEKAIL